MRLLLFFVLLSSCTVVSSQRYDPAKVSKPLSVKYGLALNEAKSRNYAKAIQLLDECIAADPRFVDAWLSKAGILSETRQYAASVPLYRKAFSLDSLYSSSYLLPFSIALAGNGQFEEALERVTRFLEKPNLNERLEKAARYRQNSYRFALEWQQQHPPDGFVYRRTNLGDSINTVFSEYFPSLTIDGKQLVFTRRVNNMNEDFYTSEQTGSSWSRARPLPGELNTADNEGAQTISQDGQWLIFTGCNMEDGEGSCDLFISYLTKNGWSRRQNMGRRINTEFWESQPSLSPDKRALYFAAKHPSGLGGSDLYVSYLQPNGQWGTPENLGTGINTAGDESSPFIHPDNLTLYFTSSGHPGYGGTDLFLVRRQPNGSWGTPENLGYPINTIDDEGTLTIASDGVTAYYASDGTDSRGGLDLYTFRLPQRVQPFRTLWVTGKVYDRNTGEGLPSAVELTDLQTGYTLSRVQTNEDGSYLITLPVGKNYAFNVNRRGYLFYSGSFALEAPQQQDTTYTLNIPLVPLEAGAAVVLQNIFFSTGAWELQPASLGELDRVVQLLNDNPTLRIELIGHTDNVGKPADNQLLSQNRARAVVNYLVSKGIAAGRLQARGMGATQPVADNSTEAGRAQNRRTELRVVGR
ncbi:MAG TPA: OmpA family protein [Lacibacter sp.]|nr:OmpA family protein [Lacibacter sp.]